MSVEPTKGNYELKTIIQPEQTFAVKKGVVDLDLRDTKTSPKQKIKTLVSGQPLIVPFKGQQIPLTITEFAIQEKGEIRTQIKNPQYREKLLAKGQNITCYAFAFQDPNRPKPEGYDDAEAAFRKFETVEKKILADDPLTPDEEALVNSEFVLKKQTAEANFNDAKARYEKPTISLKILETGELGEVSNIAVQSPSFTGTNLMELIEKFRLMIGIQEMYLEDDSKIESTSQGSYSLRLFRLFNGQGSWYEDKFHYMPVTEISSSSVRLLGAKTVEKVLAVLKDPGIDQEYSEKLKQVLLEHSPKLTMKELISKIGEEIIKNKKPLNSQMNALLEGYLVTLKNYKGEDPAILELKKEAEKILEANCFRKDYT